MEPHKVMDVESIHELDLSPFILSEFTNRDKSLKLKTPMTLEPVRDESGELLCLNYEELGIDIFAFTREELGNELIDHMDFLWRVYANGDESQMTPQARELRSKLREMIQEEIKIA